jgi:hypothetical protein
MKKILYTLSVGVLVSSSFFTVLTPTANAVTASDWKAGRIIDDGIFTDANSMSTQEIQNFLNSQNPACDNNGTKSVGYYYNASTGQVRFSWFSGGTWVTTSRATFANRYNAYNQTSDANLPFTCLKEYYEVPKTTPGPGLPASNANGAPIPAGAVSAAQLISDAAKAYNISPKVLLVKLHTESAGPLTTDDWPFRNQYLYAMGAHCPDSGPGGSANCDSNYAGFSIQMREAAALLRWYLDNMTQSWWQYKRPYQTNNILWNVAPSGCGGGNVYLESKASAALYTYTPYQPNQAALNNMYGTGDNCSAYGNRNFWRIFNDWFGTSSLNLKPIRSSATGSGVYLVENNTKRPFESVEALYSHGYTWANVVTVPESSFTSLPLGVPLGINVAAYSGKLIRSSDSGSGVYLVENNTKRPFESVEALYSHGYTWANVVTVSNAVIAGIPLGSPLGVKTNSLNLKPIRSSATGSGVYLVENNTKRPFESVEALYSHGYTWANVVTVPESSFTSLPLGVPLGINVAAYSGKLIRSSDSGSGVYLVENNTKRPFESVEALYSHGYTWANVVTVSNAVIAGIPLGSPLGVKTTPTPSV